MKGNARKNKVESASLKKEERPFWQDLEEMLDSNIFKDDGSGYLDGSMSGESWKAFLQTVRDETVNRLNAYRTEAEHSREFRASSLHPYCEQRMKIEREYLRALVDLYCSAEKAYKTLSG